MDGDILVHGSLGSTPAPSDGEEDVAEVLERLGAERTGHAVEVDDEIWFQNAGFIASSQILEQTAEIIADHAE